MKTKHFLFLMLSIMGFIAGCIPEDLLKVTIIETGNILDSSYNSATASGIFTDLSGNVTDFGHCWNTAVNPTVDNFKNKVNGIAQIGTYNSTLTQLNGGTKYYVRAYALDGGQPKYGKQVEFYTKQTPTISITSPDGQSHWGGGESYSITWTDAFDMNITMQLLKGNSVILNFENGGNIPNNGLYKWNMPVSLDNGADYRVKITSGSNNQIIALSEAFEIGKPPVDYDGNLYKIVKIGSQWWMKENLRSIKYYNGNSLIKITDGTVWQSLTKNDKVYCYYNNDSTKNASLYGVLYTWAAAMNSSVTAGAQGICPTGWHLPSDADWKEMEMALGMSSSEADKIDWRGENEGGKLKEMGINNWVSPNTGATNEIGFTAVPGGFRSKSTGNFGNLGTHCYLWTSTSEGTDNAWYRDLSTYEQKIARFNALRPNGYSVRCVRN